MKTLNADYNTSINIKPAKVTANPVPTTSTSTEPNIKGGLTPAQYPQVPINPVNQDSIGYDFTAIDTPALHQVTPTNASTNTLVDTLEGREQIQNAWSASTNQIQENVPTLDWLKSFVDSDTRDKINKSTTEQKNAIIQKLRDKGINFEEADGKLIVYGTDGTPYDITPGFWESLGESMKYNAAEITGAVVGGAAAVAATAGSGGLGALAAGGIYSATAAAATAGVAALLGSAGGSMLGSAVDDLVFAPEYVKLQNEKLVEDKKAAQIIQSAIDAGNLDMLGGLVFSAGGKILEKTGLDRLAAATASKTGSVIKNNLGTRQGLTRTAVSSTVGATTTALTGSPLIGTAAGVTTNLLMRGLMGKEATEEVGGSLFNKATGTFRQAQATVVDKIADRDFAWFAQYYKTADQAQLDNALQMLQAQGVNVNNLSAKEKHILSVLTTQSNTDAFWKALGSLDKGFPGQFMQWTVHARAQGVADIVKGLGSQDLTGVISSISNIQSSVKDAFTGLSDVVDNLGVNYKLKLGTSDAISAYYGKVYGLHKGNLPSMFTGSTSKAEAKANLDASTNPYHRQLALQTNKNAKINKAIADANISQPVTLGNLLDVLLDFSTVNTSGLAADALKKHNKVIGDLNKNIDNLLSQAVKENKITASDMGAIKNAIKSSQEQLRKANQVNNLKLAQMLRAGKSQEDIINVLVNASKGTDNSYLQLMDALSPEERLNVEGLVLNRAIENIFKKDKHTGMDWVALNDTLRHVKTVTREGAAVKELVNQYADTFKNDINIYKLITQSSGKSASSGTAGSGFSTNLISRLRTRLTSVTFKKGLEMVSDDFKYARLVAKAVRSIRDDNLTDAVQISNIKDSFNSILTKSDTQDQAFSMSVKEFIDNWDKTLQTIQNINKNSEILDQVAKQAIDQGATPEQAEEIVLNTVANSIPGGKELLEQVTKATEKSATELTYENSTKLVDDKLFTPYKDGIAALVVNGGKRNAIPMLNKFTVNYALGSIERAVKEGANPEDFDAFTVAKALVTKLHSVDSKGASWGPFNKQFTKEVFNKLAASTDGAKIAANADKLAKQAEVANAVTSAVDEVVPTMTTTRTDNPQANRDALMANFKAALGKTEEPKPEPVVTPEPVAETPAPLVEKGVKAKKETKPKVKKEEKPKEETKLVEKGVKVKKETKPKEAPKPKEEKPKEAPKKEEKPKETKLVEKGVKAKKEVKPKTEEKPKEKPKEAPKKEEKPKEEPKLVEKGVKAEVKQEPKNETSKVVDALNAIDAARPLGDKLNIKPASSIDELKAKNKGLDILIDTLNNPKERDAVLNVLNSDRLSANTVEGKVSALNKWLEDMQASGKDDDTHATLMRALYLVKHFITQKI